MAVTTGIGHFRAYPLLDLTYACTIATFLDLILCIQFALLKVEPFNPPTTLACVHRASGKNFQYVRTTF